MTQRTTRKASLSLALALGIGAGAVLLTGLLDAQGQDGAAATAPESAGIQIGTYDLQTAFEQSAAQQKMMELAGTIQGEMEAAQADGAMENMQALQQRFEQERMQIVNQFHSDVAQVVPDLAEAAGVQVIALEIAYSAENVEVEDLTAELVTALNDQDGADGDDEDESAAVSPLQLLQQ